jgi:hypothetical protein
MHHSQLVDQQVLLLLSVIKKKLRQKITHTKLQKKLI